MAEWYRVTPRNRTAIAAYGRVWPELPSLVQVPGGADVDTIQRLDGDSRFDVERVPDTPPAAADNPPADPKPPSRAKRQAKS